VGLLIGSATMIMRDVIQPVRKKKWDHKQEMLISRLLVLLVSGVTLMMAMQVRSILGAIMIGLSLTTAYTIILMATLYAPKLCRRSTAFWCLTVGIVALLAWQFGPEAWHGSIPHVIYLEWAACLAAFFIVALLDKHKCAIPLNYAKRLEPSPAETEEPAKDEETIVLAAR
jgi:SSS family solute:Na+ symporter